MTTYYVDYAAGSDANSGTSISSPWQHAPGDPNATGNAKIILIGGAKVLFKAGVVYRGSITVQSSGTPGNPIVYEGIGWGEGKATLSGLTAAEVTFTSYPDSPNLSVATLAPWMKPTLSNVVELDGKVAWMANNSTSANPYTPDIGAMSFSPSQMTGSGTSWTFTDPKVSATLSSANPSIIPNLIFRTYLFGNNYRNLNVTGYDPNTGALSLSGGFLMPNTPPHYFLYNDPAFVSSSNPYPEYAIEGNQIIAAVTPGLHTVSVSTSPFAFHATNKSYVTFDGFNISGYGAGDGRGIEVFGSQNIQVTNNTVSDIAMLDGYGHAAIWVYLTNNLTISNNNVGPGITYGAGIEANNGTDVVIANNNIKGIGWTGIVAFDDVNLSISYNRISDTLYTHGIGIIVYDVGTRLKNGQESQNISITNNQIENGNGGIAFEGDITLPGPAPEPNNFTVAYNVITNQGGWGLMDFGKTNTANVYGNIVSMRPKDFGALAISSTSTNVSYHNNILQDYTWLNPKKMPSATFSNNVALGPKNAPPGVNNTADPSLAPILQQALASPGLLPASIGSILRPTGPGAIGIDYMTEEPSASHKP